MTSWAPGKDIVSPERTNWAQRGQTLGKLLAKRGEAVFYQRCVQEVLTVDIVGLGKEITLRVSSTAPTCLLSRVRLSRLRTQRLPHPPSKPKSLRWSKSSSVAGVDEYLMSWCYEAVLADMTATLRGGRGLETDFKRDLWKSCLGLRCQDQTTGCMFVNSWDWMKTLFIIQLNIALKSEK